MINRYVRHATAFDRSATNATQSHIPAGPTTEQQLAEALQTISQLNARLAKLEAALDVKPNGDVEIFAPGAVRIEASTKVEIIGNQRVEVQGGQVAKIQDTQGNSVVLNSSGVATTSSSKAKVDCATHEVSSAMSKVNTGMAEFSGVVKCTTLIADTVTGKTYTPGAGNVW